MLSTKADGSLVEFTVWVSEVSGNEKLGIEVVGTEGKESHPLALITLKDGQKNPGQEKNLCFRGQISKRSEAGATVVYYIKEAETIDCY